ncbi:YbaB/EbfC family nucleoid-associated protein [Nocardia alni]|uniref:YbaB/EbfC family nucleoid-associated protein n=1 Tax=Nocardia alni TaxID=2815723 RepID=UPI001C2109F6|nr:YbaB/EbfC family nucleoid-associated protein [Nocardia alni]
MVNLPEWERHLQQKLADIQRDGQQLASQAAAVRGRHEVSGVLVEVDANGDITSLQIAPGVMRWTSQQLTAALLDCHRKARADAKSKLARLASQASPRIQDQLTHARTRSAAPEQARHPLSEAEIQAADDHYFEKRNLQSGWT